MRWCLRILKLKPVRWGKGTERVSEEIDKYVYIDE